MSDIEMNGEVQETTSEITNEPPAGRNNTANRNGTSEGTLPENQSIDELIRLAEAEEERLKKVRRLQLLNERLSELRRDTGEKPENPPSEVAETDDSTYNLPTTPRASTQDASFDGEVDMERDEDSVSGRTRSRLRPKDLPIYKGQNIPEHQRWCRAAKIAFRLTPDTFTTELTKVTWATQFLEGEPADSWERHEADLEKSSITWDYFARYLLNLVEDPVNRQLHTAQLYQEARQSADQSVHNFEVYLSRLEAQLPSRSEEQRRMDFFTKLRPDLRAALTNYQDLPVAKDSLVALAARLEMNQRRNRGPTLGSHRVTKPGDRQEKKGKGHHKEDKEEGRSLKERRLEGQRNDGGGGKKTDIKDVTCFNCNKKGHFAANCPGPYNPNRVPVGGVGNSQKERGSKKGGVPSSGPH